MRVRVCTGTFTGIFCSGITRARSVSFNNQQPATTQQHMPQPPATVYILYEYYTYYGLICSTPTSRRVRVQGPLTSDADSVRSSALSSSESKYQNTNLILTSEYLSTRIRGYLYWYIHIFLPCTKKYDFFSINNLDCSHRWLINTIHYRYNTMYHAGNAITIPIFAFSHGLKYSIRGLYSTSNILYCSYDTCTINQKATTCTCIY